MASYSETGTLRRPLGSALPRSGVSTARPATGIADSEYPTGSLFLSAAFCLYLLVWFLEFNVRFPALGTIRFEFLLGSVLVVAAFTAIAAHWATDDGSRVTKYIALYFAFLVCHLAVSQHIEVSWKTFVDWVVKFACIALFTTAFVRNPKTLRLFVAMLLLAFFKVGQEALWGNLTGSMVWENQGIMRLNGPQDSRYGHPNSLSGYAVCMLPFLYHLFPVVGRKSKVCLTVMMMFSANIIVFTGSRTGYLASIAFAGFAWKRSKNKGRVLAALLLVAAIGIPMVPTQYQDRFVSAFVGQEAEGNSKESRLEVATDAWNLFLRNPQGVGIYAFRQARAEQLGKPLVDTHNMYLQILADLGALGVLVFGALIFALFRELRLIDLRLAENEVLLRQATTAGSRETAAQGERHLGDVRFMRATARAFSGYLFVRLVLALFGHDLYEVYWWLAAGAAIAIVNMLPVVSARTVAITKAAQPQSSTDAVSAAADGARADSSGRKRFGDLGPSA